MMNIDQGIDTRTMETWSREGPRKRTGLNSKRDLNINLKSTRKKTRPQRNYTWREKRKAERQSDANIYIYIQSGENEATLPSRDDELADDELPFEWLEKKVGELSMDKRNGRLTRLSGAATGGEQRRGWRPLPKRAEGLAQYFRNWVENCYLRVL